MNRLRIVTKPFSAKKYAKEPPESANFSPADKVVFWKNLGDAHVIFGREQDHNKSDPFVLDRSTLESNTQEVSSSIH
jgi:hypothetical protein